MGQKPVRCTTVPPEPRVVAVVVVRSQLGMKYAMVPAPISVKRTT